MLGSLLLSKEGLKLDIHRKCVFQVSEEKLFWLTTWVCYKVMWEFIRKKLLCVSYVLMYCLVSKVSLTPSYPPE